MMKPSSINFREELKKETLLRTKRTTASSAVLHIITGVNKGNRADGILSNTIAFKHLSYNEDTTGTNDLKIPPSDFKREKVPVLIPTLNRERTPLEEAKLAIY